MAVITLIDLGATPNDGQGDPLRTGGQEINTNFTNLNTDKLEAGGYAGTGQDLFNGITAIGNTYTPNGGYLGTSQDLFNLIGGAVNQFIFTPQPGPIAIEQGKLYYDLQRDTLTFFNSSPNVSVNIGEEILIRILNDTGQPLGNGTVVRITGATGGIPTVDLPVADEFANAVVNAITTEPIAAGATGYCTVTGLLGYDTTGLAEGTLLYLSSATPGALTTNAPRVTVPLAVVLNGNSSVAGTIAFEAKAPRSEGAIAQAGGVNIAEDVTNVDTPLSTYDNAVNIEKNLILTNTPAGNGETAVISLPGLFRFAGFYTITFTISLTSSDNAVFIFTAYKNGAPTNAVTQVDLTNNNINSGSTSWVGILPNELLPGETIEWRVRQSGGGTATFTANNVVFSAQLNLSI